MAGDSQYPESKLTTHLSKLFILTTFISLIHIRFDISVLGFITALLLCSLLIGLPYRFFNVILKVIQNGKMKGWIISSVSISHLIFACSLGIVRQIPKNEDIVWGIDNRMFLSRAYKFFRFGNQEDSLSYFGYDYKYHAMPSYMSAQLDRHLQIPLDMTLFLILPILAYITIFVVVFEISKSYGLTNVESGVISILFCSISYLNSVSQIIRLSNPLISIDTMPNTELAIAVILCAIRLTLIYGARAFTWLTILGFSLVAIKPQFIPFYWLIVIVIHLLIPKKISKKLLSLNITACLLSLFIQVLYNYGNIQAEYSLTFISPDFLNFLKNNSIVIGCWICLVALQIVTKSKSNPKIHLLLCSYLLLRLLFDIMYFNATGPTQKLLKQYLNLEASGDSDFDQGFILLYLAVFLAVIIILSSSIRPELKNLHHAVVIAILFGLAGARLFIIAPALTTPEVYGKEPINLRPLHELLKSTRAENPVFLVNDVSDPTENYRRYGSGMYWSSLGIGQFYLSDIQTGHFLAPDIEKRKRNVTKFFNSEISRWHSSFLKKEGIEYVLINKRCEPSWLNKVKFLSSNEKFVLVAKDEFVNVSSGTIEHSKPQFKKSGIAPCL